MMNNLYACVVAREFPLQSLLRLRPELKQKPIAVLDGEPPSEQICSLSDAAYALGVTPGMTRVETDMFPAVIALLRSQSQEAVTRIALLEGAGCYSPLVEDQSSDGCFICVADITGTASLFGPPDVLAKSLRQHLLALSIKASVAVSSNFHASVCLALGGKDHGICVVPLGMERTALASLPLSVLPLSLGHAETFSLWGINTLGELAEIKETELITRLGQQGKTLSMLARGEAPHLFRAQEPGLQLEERMELDTPVELLESLLFIAGVMLDQLIIRVQSRILALASVTLRLGLDNGGMHTRTVRPALPSTDRKLWLKLIHLDLQANPPAEGIHSLILNGQPGSNSKVQLGLFSPQVPEPMRLDVTLARIRNIVGDGCVGSAELNDTHRPDSFRMANFQVPPGLSATVPPEATPQRMAMRQLRPAEAATVTLKNERPDALIFREKRYVVEHIYGPWSSAGDWWKPSLWSVEQWDVVLKTQDNAQWLCCCLTHHLTQGEWQVEALYD